MDAPGSAELQEQLRLAIQEIASLSARVHELEVRQQERQDDGGAPLVMPYLQIHQSLSGLATGVRRISSVPSITQDGSGGSTTAALRLQQANSEHKPSTPRAANGHAKSAGSPLGLRTPSGDLSNLEIPMAVSKGGCGSGDTRTGWSHFPRLD